jgi:predicted transcriptional regulator
MADTQALAMRLKKTGLPEKAAIVYAHLLESGGAFPSNLAQKTRINRSTVYKILTDLSIKGLINEIQKGKKLYYQAERPAKLLRYARHQVDAAGDAYESVQKIFPELEGIYSLIPNKPRILYFEGSEGVLSIYEDHVTEQKPYEMLGIANTNEVLKFLGDTYFKKYRKMKERIGITTRGILPTGKESERYATDIYGDVSEKTRPRIRFLPKENFPFKGEITVYGTNKVSVMNLDEKYATGIVIEDETFHGLMRTIFDLAWKGSQTKVSD